MPNLEILLHTKFHPIWTTGSKDTAIFRNFKNWKSMTITFEPVVQIGVNFVIGNIFWFGDLFAKQTLLWSKRSRNLFSNLTFAKESWRLQFATVWKWWILALILTLEELSDFHMAGRLLINEPIVLHAVALGVGVKVSCSDVIFVQVTKTGGWLILKVVATLLLSAPILAVC